MPNAQAAFSADIGPLVRGWRLKSGFSEEQVREILELPSVERLQLFEKGLLELPLEEICALSNLFNIPPEDVMACIRLQAE